MQYHPAPRQWKQATAQSLAIPELARAISNTDSARNVSNSKLRSLHHGGIHNSSCAG